MIISARSNQSILKEINPEYTLEVLMLRLKLQYFGHLMWWQARHWKRPSCWERLKAGGEGDDRGWDGWMASLTQWTWVWVNSGSWWQTGRPGVLRFMGSQRVGHEGVTELNWTRFVTAFLPRTKHLLISWLQSLSVVILEPKKRKSVTAFTFPPSICHDVIELHAMILVFLNECFLLFFFFFFWGLSQLYTLLFHFHQEAL